MLLLHNVAGKPMMCLQGGRQSCRRQRLPRLSIACRSHIRGVGEGLLLLRGSELGLLLLLLLLLGKKWRGR